MTLIADRAATNRRWSGRWVVFGVALVAGVIAACIAALGSTDALAATGLSDPGPVTTFGLPFVRAAGEIAAMTAIGHFLLAAFLVPPQASGVLDVDGYRALRVGTVACAVWATCAALLVALTVSDVSGVPLTSLTPMDVWSAAGLVEVTSAWRTTSILAGIVAVVSMGVLRWSWTPALLIGGLATLVPLAVTGHSSSGGSHDIATNSLLIHLIAAALWAGGLLALVGHALRGGSHTDLAVRRFSGLALWCFVAMGVSGIVNAAVRIEPSDIWDSTYGLFVVAKVTTLVGLGAIGWYQRRSSIRALQHDPTSRRPLVRLALCEAVVFGVAVGIAVGLGRTPPPPPPTLGEPSRAQVALGFDLAGPPTIDGVFFDWRFDLIFGTAAVAMAWIYLVALRRLLRRGDPWPPGRTVCWVFGCLTMLFVTSSGLGRYMTAMFSIHVAVQLLLTLLVPALLVRGAPLTLALKTLRKAEPGAAAGPREWLQSAMDSPPARLITNPWAALGIFAVGIYGLLVPRVFNAAVGAHTAHMVTVGYFLFSGVLLFAAASGTGAMARSRVRIRGSALLLIAVSQFVIVGLVLTSRQGVLGEAFYASLKLSWHADLLGDQRLGGVIVAAGGVLAVFAVVGVRLRRGIPRHRFPAVDRRARGGAPGG